MENILNLPGKLASLAAAQRLTRIIMLLALLACLGVVLYVAGAFVYEGMYPPAPVSHGFFGDDGSRASRLVNPALRWIGRIILLPTIAQGLTGVLFCWRDKPFAWKLLGSTAMLLLSWVLLAASGLSCGC
ncbi:MAG TPA: hypothetical protein VGB98_16015 [Pyrinomonadaceae bacterium]|jgi:hypothetical protein